MFYIDSSSLMHEARFHILLPIGLYHSNWEKKNGEYEEDASNLEKRMVQLRKCVGNNTSKNSLYLTTWTLV
jgi:hypothetical protein